MRLADWALRALVAFTFFVLLFAPQKWGSALVLFCFVAVGAWSLFYPQGVLGWAKTAHPSLDVDDQSICGFHD